MLQTEEKVRSRWRGCPKHSVSHARLARRGQKWGNCRKNRMLLKEYLGAREYVGKSARQSLKVRRYQPRCMNRFYREYSLSEHLHVTIRPQKGEPLEVADDALLWKYCGT
jgi:hypothetical protein